MKCIEDEIPFELPEGWEWCRFMSVTVNRDSERKPISSANRTNVAKIYDYYGASGKIDKIDKFIFNEKLLLIGEDGANLVTRSKPIAFFAEGQYWVNNHAHCIDSTDKLILEYLCLYINAISLEKYVTGSAQPKMTQDNMNSILIALPPYEEQKRLEFQVNHILKTVSTIENKKEDIVNYIVSAKSKILDLAIRGKLVPQDPDDEPASVLLERIRTEKEELIKQGKGDNSPSISKNDIENWLYPIPPIAEQKRICYILKSTYTIIERLEAYVYHAQVHTLKKLLLFQILRYQHQVQRNHLYFHVHTDLQKS